MKNNCWFCENDPMPVICYYCEEEEKYANQWKPDNSCSECHMFDREVYRTGENIYSVCTFCTECRLVKARLSTAHIEKNWYNDDMELSAYIKNYKVKKNESNINNPRAYWLNQFIIKLEDQKKKDNWRRFIMWRGKPINPKFVKAEELEEFKKAKLPKDKRYLKPWTAKQYGVKLGHVQTEDLQPFYDMCMRCDDSKTGYNFTVCFFHNLKVDRKDSNAV